MNESLSCQQRMKNICEFAFHYRRIIGITLYPICFIGILLLWFVIDYERMQVFLKWTRFDIVTFIYFSPAIAIYCFSYCVIASIEKEDRDILPLLIIFIVIVIVCLIECFCYTRFFCDNIEDCEKIEQSVIAYKGDNELNMCKDNIVVFNGYILSFSRSRYNDCIEHIQGKRKREEIIKRIYSN